MAQGIEQTRRMLQAVLTQLQARERFEQGAQRRQLADLCSNLMGIVGTLSAATEPEPSDGSDLLQQLARAYDDLSATLALMQSMPGAAEEQRRCAQALAMLFASGGSQRSSAPPRRPSSTRMQAVRAPEHPASNAAQRPSAPSIEVAELDEAPQGELGVQSESCPPISPAPSRGPTSEPPPSERRGSPRLAFEVEVGFVSETHFYAGLSLDVSTGGLFIATYQLQPVGTRMVVTFVLPSGHAVTSNAVVQWVREGSEETSPGLGVSLQLDGEDARQVKMFCERREPLFIDMD